MTSTSKQAARRKARVKALQALYQWDLNLEAGNDPDAPAIRRQFIDTQDMQGVDQECFDNLLLGSIDTLAELDKSLEDALDRKIVELDPIERSVCRLGAYELAHQLDVPLRVVINEWVEVSKRFGSDQGYKYVNGVMDKLGAQLRALEFKALKKTSKKKSADEAAGSGGGGK